jgi:hypothetical protein
VAIFLEFVKVPHTNMGQPLMPQPTYLCLSN